MATLFRSAIILASIFSLMVYADQSGNSAATIAPRTAQISEIVNLVETRNSAEQAFGRAVDYQILTVGNQVKTGLQSQARLDFSEGSVVRLGQNTLLTVNAIATRENPIERLYLQAGKLWISLTGGAIDVETPIGIATVRGSFALLEYDQQAEALTFDCIEGSCKVQNDAVQEQMGNLERVALTNQGKVATRELLTGDAVQEFVRASPNSQHVVATLTAAPPVTRIPRATLEPRITLEPRPTLDPRSTLDPRPTFDARATLDPRVTMMPRGTLDLRATLTPHATLSPSTITSRRTPELSLVTPIATLDSSALTSRRTPDLSVVTPRATVNLPPLTSLATVAPTRGNVLATLSPRETPKATVILVRPTDPPPLITKQPLATLVPPRPTELRPLPTKPPPPPPTNPPPRVTSAPPPPTKAPPPPPPPPTKKPYP